MAAQFVADVRRLEDIGPGGAQAIARHVYTAPDELRPAFCITVSVAVRVLHRHRRAHYRLARDAHIAGDRRPTSHQTLSPYLWRH
ncbi:hypothetical protein [Pseudoxanthomonas sp. UTMC 1351]|uniref:hypothetical protein n=1 Tax=Pseudoxanthomonas sp. UTMC 1351 TaxID=2695853 RepID=UPI0034CDB140